MASAAPRRSLISNVSRRDARPAAVAVLAVLLAACAAPPQPAPPQVPPPPAATPAIAPPTPVAAAPSPLQSPRRPSLARSGDPLAGVTVSGGDGSRIEDAVVIDSPADAYAGVRAVYAWLQQRYPASRRVSQAHVEAGGRHYDVLEIADRDGRRRRVYFDITSFYGKL